MASTLRYPEHFQDPFYAGHFPGEPVLPGVAQVLRVEEAVRSLGIVHPLTRLSRIKFTHAISPGPDSELTLDVTHNTAAFSFSQGLQACSKGVMYFDSDTPTLTELPAWLTTAAANPESKLPTCTEDFERFMPHRRPMLWLDRVHMLTDERLITSRRVEASLTSNAVVLELFAQTASAHFGYLAVSKGGVPNGGALLGSRQIVFFDSALPSDMPVYVAVEMTLAMPPLAQFSCWAFVRDGERLRALAQGSINVAMGLGR